MTTQLLMLLTKDPVIRSEVIGWQHEDITRFYRGKPIGFTSPPKNRYEPKTVFEALADGWDLIGPPIEMDDDTFEWWLKR